AARQGCAVVELDVRSAVNETSGRGASRRTEDPSFRIDAAAAALVLSGQGAIGVVNCTSRGQSNLTEGAVPILANSRVNGIPERVGEKRRGGIAKRDRIEQGDEDSPGVETLVQGYGVVIG